MITRQELPDKIWQVRDLVRGNRAPRDEVEADFIEYHRANPQVYQEFCRYAFVLLKAGKKQASAWHIINRMRWDFYIQAVDDNSDFVISNDYISLFSRLFMEDNRECVDWFDTKLRDVEQKIVDKLGETVQSRALSRRLAA